MMTEYLSIPAWNTPTTTLEAWVGQLSEVGGPVIVARESSTVAWLEVSPIRLKGYVVLENGHPTAINFELHASDPSPAFRALCSATEALGWELYEDDGEDSEDDEE